MDTAKATGYVGRCGGWRHQYDSFTVAVGTKEHPECLALQGFQTGIGTLTDTNSPWGERVTLSACFLAGGLGIGSWGANLPALGRRAGLDEGALGVVLLFFAAGAIRAMTNAPRLIARIGAGRLSAIAAGLFGLGIAGVGWITQMAVATAVASLAGFTFGALDVAMNSQAAYLERRARRPVMSSFHAMFSAGTLLAALTYAVLAHRGIGSGMILSLLGGMIMAIAVVALICNAFPPHVNTDDAPVARDRNGRDTVVLALGALAFVIFLAEGAIMDWSAVYLVRVIGTSESVGATGYAVFACTMLMGRLLGDRVNRAFGPSRLFRVCAITVALSLAMLVLAGSVDLAFAALACAGLAMANLIPIIFSAAGVLGSRDGGRSLSRVLTMGYAGILLGPALIGFVAQALSLTVSLFLVFLSLVITAFFSRTLEGEPVYSP